VNKTTKYILIVLISISILFQYCLKEKLPPIARFNITPSKGNTESIFVFDASISRGDNNEYNEIEARWDWNNDGKWDTKFSSNLIAEYQFNSPGEYIISLEIKDKDGQRSILSRELLVTKTGPLYVPQIISPKDKATNQSPYMVLKWSCFHSEDSKILYDVYFGDIPTPPLIKKDYNSTIFNPGYLESSKEYFWRIIAKDEMGNTARGPLLRFYTHLVDERDGIIYKVFPVHDTYWTAENLKFLPDSGSWYLGDKPENYNTFGRLYNWGTAKKACPIGWHLPTDEEWKNFEKSLGMTDSDNWGARGTIQGEKIREGGSHPFNALMAGTRNLFGEYNLLGIDTGFWTSTKLNDFVFYRYLFYNQPFIYRSAISEHYALSVRCVKDNVQ